jgi:hypothetical protein
MNSLNKIRSNLGNRLKLSNQASNIAKKALNSGAAFKNRVSNMAQGLSTSFKDKMAQAQQKVSNIGQKSSASVPLSQFGTMTQEFFNANTAISNFVTFILCLILFLILFQLGSAFVLYAFGPQYNPYVINGMMPSNVQKIVSANPNVSNSAPIFRSIDEDQGIEFSWNVWFIVQDATNVNATTGGALIFSKGTSNATSTSDNIMNKYLNVSPGLFLQPGANSNQLALVLNTFDEKNPNDPSKTTFNEIITIPNIPMQKWICCTIRVQGTYVDVYINGVLTKRTILLNIPKQNYYDTYIGDSAGFKGYISSLRYYAKAISYEEIQSLFAAGPALKMLDSTDMPISNDFLSMNWYYKYTNLASS